MKSTPFAVLFLSTVLVSCQTVNHDIPDGSSPEIYFQKAQAETDTGHYALAQSIFEEFLAKAAEGQVEEALSARFEVALLKAKQGQTALAIKDYQSILADFQDVAKSAQYPGWVKVLSQKKLEELQGPAKP